MQKITFSAFFVLTTALCLQSSEKIESNKKEETQKEETQTVKNIVEYVDYPGQVQIPEQSPSYRTKENQSPNFSDFTSISDFPSGR